ncbi:MULTISPECIES: hypothetical protein [Aeromonas]|uniref:hypothetical protein n=1 Tax=Aeromonas TaxID=642 RepID=UPI002B054AD9|nr:hypothetical protein [Aeromonas jandaei]
MSNANTFTSLRRNSHLRLSEIDYPENPFERNPNAQAAAKQWADNYIAGMRYALEVNKLSRKIMPAFRSNVTLVSEPHIISMNALISFLGECIDNVVIKTTAELNVRYGDFILHDPSAISSLAKVSDEIAILPRFTVSVRHYHLLDDDSRALLKKALFDNDYDAFKNQYPILGSRDAIKPAMDALRRYFELTPELISEFKEHIFGYRDGTIGEWVFGFHHFMLAHVFFPEKIKAALDDVKANGAILAAEKFKSELRNVFFHGLDNRAYEQDKPVKLSFRIVNGGPKEQISAFEKIVRLAYRLMEEGNPEAHLTEFLNDEVAAATFKGSNGQSIRVYQSHLTTTVRADTADKMMALIDVPDAELARLIEAMVNR